MKTNTDDGCLVGVCHFFLCPSYTLPYRYVPWYQSYNARSLYVLLRAHVSHRRLIKTNFYTDRADPRFPLDDLDAIQRQIES